MYSVEDRSRLDDLPLINLRVDAPDPGAFVVVRHGEIRLPVDLEGFTILCAAGREALKLCEARSVPLVYLRREVTADTPCAIFAVQGDEIWLSSDLQSFAMVGTAGAEALEILEARSVPLVDL